MTIRRAFGVLITMLAALFAPPQPAVVTEPTTPGHVSLYVYNSPSLVAALSSALGDRGPPSAAPDLTVISASESAVKLSNNAYDTTTQDARTSAFEHATATTATASSGRPSSASAQLRAPALSVVAPNSGPGLLRSGGGGSSARLPMTPECVCQVANKYGVDISDVNIDINKSRVGYYGSTAPDQTITLTRSAFSSEEQLARMLTHERFC